MKRCKRACIRVEIKRLIAQRKAWIVFSPPPLRISEANPAIPTSPAIVLFLDEGGLSFFSIFLTKIISYGELRTLAPKLVPPCSVAEGFGASA